MQQCTTNTTRRSSGEMQQCTSWGLGRRGGGLSEPNEPVYKTTKLADATAVVQQWRIKWQVQGSQGRAHAWVGPGAGYGGRRTEGQRQGSGGG
jgi:hypothetical protein